METNDLQRLASMGAALRPDWPARSLLTFLTKHFTDRAYGDMAVALAWVATRTKTDTPRLLLEAGPWWKACQVDGTTAPRNYRVPCTEHPGETLPCGRCANERVPADAPTAAARVRAELARCSGRTNSGSPREIGRHHVTTHQLDATEQRETP